MREVRQYLADSYSFSPSDIKEFLRRFERAQGIAEELGFEWTAQMCRRLVRMKPSDWLMDAFADSHRVSRQTIKDRLFRKKKNPPHERRR